MSQADFFPSLREFRVAPLGLMIINRHSNPGRCPGLTYSRAVGPVSILCSQRTPQGGPANPQDWLGDECHKATRHD